MVELKGEDGSLMSIGIVPSAFKNASVVVNENRTICRVVKNYRIVGIDFGPLRPMLHFFDLRYRPLLARVRGTASNSIAISCNGMRQLALITIGLHRFLPSWYWRRWRIGGRLRWKINTPNGLINNWISPKIELAYGIF
jgi:hypothetical protein